MKLIGSFRGNKQLSKGWWRIAAVMFFIAAASVGCASGNNASDNQEGAEITQGVEDQQNTADEDNTQEIEQAEATQPPEEDIIDEIEGDEPSVRDNSDAVTTILNTGNFVVGPDIPRGRYVITTDNSGNLFINSEDGELKVNEIMGGGDYGVESVTTDLEEGDTIEISGSNEVTFTPYETVPRTDTLTTGTWVVGIDIGAGRYDISSTGGNGNLFVYDRSGFPVVNEILGGGDYGVEKVTTNLEEGYIINVSGMKEVKLTGK